MTNSPSIAPPPGLVDEWFDRARLHPLTPLGIPLAPLGITRKVAEWAAQWGADQELEACCELLPGLTSYLREERRPKLLSLKEQALKELAWVDKNLKVDFFGHCDAIHIIRRALEALPND